MIDPHVGQGGASLEFSNAPTPFAFTSTPFALSTPFVPDSIPFFAEARASSTSWPAGNAGEAGPPYD